jgi:hypothetical protein
MAKAQTAENHPRSFFGANSSKNEDKKEFWEGWNPSDSPTDRSAPLPFHFRMRQKGYRLIAQCEAAMHEEGDHKIPGKQRNHRDDDAKGDCAHGFADPFEKMREGIDRGIDGNCGPNA